jgi:hypothetical protein
MISIVESYTLVDLQHRSACNVSLTAFRVLLLPCLTSLSELRSDRTLVVVDELKGGPQHVRVSKKRIMGRTFVFKKEEVA